MSRTRRTRLARRLADLADLTYQQALTRLDAYTAARGHLPRTDADLAAAADPDAAAAGGPQPPAAESGTCAFCGAVATHGGVYTHDAGAEVLACERHAGELLGGGHLLEEAPLRPVAAVEPVRAFTIRYSALSSCPAMVMSVSHWLPSGECAHGRPTCPTCAGRGQLLGESGPVPCDRDAGLPAGVPVCEGTGRWSGTRT